MIRRSRGFVVQLGSLCRRLATDQRGVILPLVALLIVPLIGFTALALDTSRYFDLQTQLQKAADAFALAGAAELDGRPSINSKGDAITRARAAINTLMASRNASVWGAAVTVQSITFMSKLQASDAPPITGDITTADPTQAKYVQVVVTPVSMTSIMPLTLFGQASDTLTTSATAVAGFNESVCQFTPLFICNPLEGKTTSIYDPVNIGKMFKLKQGGSNTYTPGNYGFLAISGNGANVLRDAIAAINPGACYLQNGVDTEPGNVASASDALNVRFDLYSASAKGYQGGVGTPPDQNVRKGCLPDTTGTCGEDVTQSPYCQGNKYVDPSQ